MKKGYSLLCIFLSFTMLFSPLAAAAQTWPGAAAWRASAPQARQRQALFAAFESQILRRPPELTFDTLYIAYEWEGKVNGEAFASLVSDPAYLQTLTQDQAAVLAEMASFVDFHSSSAAQNLLHLLQEKLQSDYDEQAPDFALKTLYALIMASLGKSMWLHQEVQQWAFAEVSAAAQRAKPEHKVWPAFVLMSFASPSETAPYEMSAASRLRFERKLESILRQFNWLQYEQTDFVVTGVKNQMGLTNQATLISLFTQASSFFALRDDDGFFKQMVSAGGLNPLGRALASNEQDAPGRFSDSAEDFYLHHVTPGTDGKGHFAKTPNGRRHLIVSLLVQAEFLSYFTRPTQQSSRQMQDFVGRFLQVKENGEFASYLYIPLQGIRLGNILHNASSLDGWEKEAGALEENLYGKLKAGYPWNRACTAVQGACEVAVEWAVLGKVFSLVFRGLGWGAKAAGRQVVKALPVKAVFYLGMTQVVVRQGGKSAVQWSRQTIKKLLGMSGWKAGAIGVGTISMQADSKALAR